MQCESDLLPEEHFEEINEKDNTEYDLYGADDYKIGSKLFKLSLSVVSDNVVIILMTSIGN